MLKALLFDSTQWSGNYQRNIHMNAGAVSEILRSSYPTDVVVRRVGEILVCHKFIQQIQYILTMRSQRQSIYIGRLANRDRVLLHIPRILLSASAEFEEAFGQWGSIKEPQLDRISADDERIKSSPWYRADSQIPLPQPLLSKPSCFFQDKILLSNLHR